MRFYDTCSLLLKVDNLFDEEFVISSITLEELEHIKTSSHKDADIKYQARKLIHQLAYNADKYRVWIYKDYMANHLLPLGFSELNPDLKILATAIDFDKKIMPDDVIFVTNDLSLKNIANLYFGTDSIESIEIEEDDYCGYKFITLSDDGMEEFYSHPNENLYGLEINEYAIICDSNNNPVDKVVWMGDGYRHLTYADFTSKWFGKVKPMKNDIY